MNAFIFYMVAIPTFFAVLAMIADGIGHFFPDWLEPEDDE